MWVMWVMPTRSHGLRYRPLATGHHVGHVGYANAIAWCPLTMWPCAWGFFRGLAAWVMWVIFFANFSRYGRLHKLNITYICIIITVREFLTILPLVT